MTSPPRERRSGPAGENGTAQNVEGDAAKTVRRIALISGHGSLTSEVIARRSWSYRMISRCPSPPPRYGSPEWLTLPDGDYRKVAAVVIAAESWAIEGDDLPERLRREVESARVAFKQAEDEAYVANAEAWRREQRGQNDKTSTFMRRRQAQLDGLARKPRPGDFPGRRGREGA